MQATPGASLTSEGDAPGPAPDASHPHRPARSRRLLLLLAGVALLAWTGDVVAKVVAVETLTGRPPVKVVPGVLAFDLTRNPGAAFSLGTNMTVVLTLVAVGVVVVVLRLSARVADVVWAVALGLLLGGALGNLTDRVFRDPHPFRGQVVDFLRVPHWPVFNLADSCIVVAAVLIAWQSLRGVAVDGTRGDSKRQPRTAAVQPDEDRG